ncbi:hypothetical protein SeMB42_g00245 [Synchytrium endobioticum]|uniref:Ribosome biogenesis protein NSA1 n=1 Tax=Synchytrium endobioticum TaxID=286115 RepID=A0A507DUE4_9FUNG|nr:hypothetical protein SeLEV6574_g05197 [Synchytrium endobioticum]TPX54558.1 hypothetical protein SeMB42_g00245 [Synchytrium endobioticum]
MHFLVGDQSGLIKDVRIPPPAKSLSKRKRDAEASAEKPASVIQTYGSMDMNRAVDQMCWCSMGGAHTDQVVVARKGGRISRVSSTTGQEVGSFAPFQIALDSKGLPKLNKHRQADYVVGIAQEEGSILSCSNTGLVHLHRQDPETEQSHQVISASLNQDLLFRMRASPENINVFATGGDERDLCIWDLNTVSSSSENGKFQPTWKAKNVPHDFLDLRVPIWITDLEYLTPSQLVTSTGYHQVRLYDIKAAKKPVMSCEVGDTPLRTITVLNANEVLVSDATGELTCLDIRQGGRVMGKYKGSTGAVRSVCIQNGHVAAVGLDRFLRIYHIKTRRMLHQVYLKQRLSSVLAF